MKKKRDIVNFLENLNIETRDMLPLVNQPVYKKMYGEIEQNFPVAKSLNDSAFYIGCHSYMHDKEVDFIIEAFHEYFKNKY